MQRIQAGAAMCSEVRRALHSAFLEGPLEFRDCWRSLPYAQLCGGDSLIELARCGRLICDYNDEDCPLSESSRSARVALERLGERCLEPALELERLALLVLEDLGVARQALALAIRRRSAPHVFVIYLRVATNVMYVQPRQAAAYFWVALAAAELCDNPIYRSWVLPYVSFNQYLCGNSGLVLQRATHDNTFIRLMTEVCHAAGSIRKYNLIRSLSSLQKEFHSFVGWQKLIANQLLMSGKSSKAQDILLDSYEQFPAETSFNALYALHTMTPFEMHWQHFFGFHDKKKEIQHLRNLLPLLDIKALAELLECPLVHRPVSNLRLKTRA